MSDPATATSIDGRSFSFRSPVDGLELQRDAWLEWLPQETILFDGARLRRRTSLSMATGSSVLAGEILAFGRAARGEELTHGLIHDGWAVVREGKPAWADIFHAADTDLVAMLGHPAALAGARASPAAPAPC